MSDRGNWHVPENDGIQGIQIRIRSHTNEGAPKSLEVRAKEFNWNSVSAERMHRLLTSLIAIDPQSTIQIIHLSDNDFDANKVTIIVADDLLNVDDFKAIAVYILHHEQEPIYLVIPKELQDNHYLKGIAFMMKVPIYKSLRAAVLALGRFEKEDTET